MFKQDAEKGFLIIVQLKQSNFEAKAKQQSLGKLFASE